MDRTTIDWKGYWPASPTPFAADGSFDEASMRALLDKYIADGVHGVLINGSTGEWWAQSDEERLRTAEVAVDQVAARIPVVIGCTSFTADQVGWFAEHAAEIGADGVLTTPPPYVHPSQEEIFRFYRDVNERVTVPLVAYNWPRGTAVEIELDTAKRIADLEHVVAFKNSTTNWISVVDYAEALTDRVRLFASLINRRGIAVMRELGGDGYIDGGALGAPFAVPFFEAFWEGRLHEARIHADRWWKATSTFIRSDFGGTFAAPNAQLKAAMAILGHPGGHVRPPLAAVEDPETLTVIESALTEVGLR